MSGVNPHVVTRGSGFTEVIDFIENDPFQKADPFGADFDWYQATFHDINPDVLISFLAARYELSDVVPARPKNGYESAASIKRGDNELITLMWGGNTGINVKATGNNSPEAATYLRRFGPHKVTRADACLDYSEPGLFDRLSNTLLAYAVEKKIKINQQGDWERGTARTLYLGSRSSVVQLVMYEKGYQADSDDLNWVRLEVRVYPKKEKGFHVATLEPIELFGTTWVAAAMKRCGLNTLKRINVGTVYKPSDAERARKALCLQYLNTIDNWVEESGSWEAFADELRNHIEQTRKDAAPRSMPQSDISSIIEDTMQL